LARAALLHRQAEPDREELLRRLNSVCAQLGQHYLAAVLSVNVRSVRRWLTGKNSLRGPAAKLVWFLYESANAADREITLFDLAMWASFFDRPAPR
jgi:hypothetical protein